jgi:hypothetical protein
MPEPPPKERARAILAELLAVLAIYALAVAFIRPSGNFPLDDDTYFGLPALEFARTGHFHLTIAPHSLRAQILWGALFVRLFGPTFDALRAASMVSFAIAIVMFHATLRRLPVARGVRLVATFAFAFHPLLFWSSFTFMTEAHFVCASVLAMHFYLRGFQEDRPSLLLCGGAAVAVSWWIRQTGIMTAIPPLVILLIFRAAIFPKWKRAAAVCTLPLVLFLAIYALRPDWLMGNSTHFYSLAHMWTEATFRLPEQIALVRHYTFLTLLNTALFLSPLVIVSARPVVRRYSRAELIAVAAVVLFFGYGVAELLQGGSPMPFYGTWPCCDMLYGSVLANLGLGPPTAAFGFDPVFGYPFGLPYAGQVLLTIIAGALAAVLGVRLLFAIPDAVANPRRDAAILLAAGYVVAHTAALCASAAYFDRYALSSAWPVAVVLAIITPKRPLWKGAIAVMLLVVAFDVVAVDEYFAWQRARWKAWYDLQGRGVSFREIDAGNEPFDFVERAYAADVHSRRRMAFGPEPRRYSIAFQPLPGMRIIGRYPFRGWLGLHEGTIFVLERVSETSSTAAHD